MTDLQRADALLYALLTEDDAPRQEAMLARALAAARREGAEAERANTAAVVHIAYDNGVQNGKLAGAEEMRERAARLADGFCTDRTNDVARGIRALPLTPEEPVERQKLVLSKGHAETRAEALEEAAQACEGGYTTGSTASTLKAVAAAIRALKSDV